MPAMDFQSWASLRSSSSLLDQHTRNPWQTIIRVLGIINIIGVLPLSSGKNSRLNVTIHVTADKEAPRRIPTIYCRISSSMVKILGDLEESL